MAEPRLGKRGLAQRSRLPKAQVSSKMPSGERVVKERAKARERKEKAKVKKEKGAQTGIQGKDGFGSPMNSASMSRGE